jgi:hypothetical protein
MNSATADSLPVAANAHYSRLFSLLLMLPNPVQTMGLLLLRSLGCSSPGNAAALCAGSVSCGNHERGSVTLKLNLGN